MPHLRLALAQLNVTVGDLAGNAGRISEAILRAKAWQADLVVCPELSLTGYPPEDLLLKPAFVGQQLEALDRLASGIRGIAAVVGFVDRDPQGRLYNAAALLAGGRRVAAYHKHDLPNYGVFDERRYFTPGSRPLLVDWRGRRFGLTICEDLWQPAPARAIASAGGALLINISASPYHAGKGHERRALFSRRPRERRLAIAYCNLVGCQDELVFDGASLVLAPQGRVLASGRQFHDDLVVTDLPWEPAGRRPGPAGRQPRGWRHALGSEDSAASVVRLRAPLRQAPPLPARTTRTLGPVEEVYEALVLGTRDYVAKNGFRTVVLGLSGGIDSCLTACLAVDALGADRVVGIVMPSRFSSRQTQDDARRLARALGIQCETVSIEPCFRAYLSTLAPDFKGRMADVTEQNLQARIRGTLLMALSNKFGWLVLTTGNKSEMATGYCTLYGDMAGGFAVIKDVPKTLVYRLAALRNRRAAVIPPRVFTRAPTAELAFRQTDQDTLPPYGALDEILTAYVEDDLSAAEIVRRTGCPRKMVERVIRMVDQSEYKRRQSPPGVKITPKAFGKDRRMPITNRYR